MSRFFGTSTESHKGYNLKLEHQQFIRNDGKNSGFFSNGKVSSDNESLTHYNHGEKKYNAEFMEKGMARYNEYLEKIGKLKNKFNPQNNYGLGYKENTYSLLENNCQDYIDKVIEFAEIEAKKAKRPLIKN